MKTYSIDTDKYDQKSKGLIDPDVLKNLSRITPWRGVLQIALEWIGIFLAVALCQYYWSPLLYVLTVAWIGARQNGLAVMMHEAVHYRLLPNRQWNDWLGEIFTAWPVSITLNGFRQTHFAHHRHVNQPEDPDWERKQNNLFKYPKSGFEIALITLKHWCGYYGVLELVGVNQEAKIPARLQYMRLGFYALVFLSSLLFNFWFELIIYWIIPLLTYFVWIVYIRGVAEHFAGIENEKELIQKTRHIDANLFERLMLAPNYIHFHIAHHLYPSVPFYKLRELHNVLMQDQEYGNKAHITKGYWGLLKECLGSR